MNFEGVIPLLGGVYCALLGFGVVAPGRNPEANALWLKKFGMLMKIVGSVLMLFGIVLLFGILR